MARTSKSPKAVALAALATARWSLQEYAHRSSPKKFTQHQLFACLVLKNFLKTDYRGLAAHLEDNPALLETLGMNQVPHFTTFPKAAHRLLQTAPARKLLTATVRLHLGRKQRGKRAAIDSTGLECSSASGYFVRRRTRVESPWKTVVYHHYPKLGVVSRIDDHFIYAYQAGRGPRHGIRTVIPPKHGRPTTKPATGRYRRLMQVRFDRPAYRQRSQVETVMSMIKRRQGVHVNGRSYWSQCRDLRLLVLTHKILILVFVGVFYRAVLTPLFSCCCDSSA